MLKKNFNAATHIEVEMENLENGITGVRPCCVYQSSVNSLCADIACDYTNYRVAIDAGRQQRDILLALDIGYDCILPSCGFRQAYSLDTRLA
jgi:hypothetical protein